jgi:hypothetical protein
METDNTIEAQIKTLEERVDSASSDFAREIEDTRNKLNEAFAETDAALNAFSTEFEKAPELNDPEVE